MLGEQTVVVVRIDIGNVIGRGDAEEEGRGAEIALVIGCQFSSGLGKS